MKSLFSLGLIFQLTLCLAQSDYSKNQFEILDEIEGDHYEMYKYNESKDKWELVKGYGREYEKVEKPDGTYDIIQLKDGGGKLQYYPTDKVNPYSWEYKSYNAGYGRTTHYRMIFYKCLRFNVESKQQGSTGKYWNYESLYCSNPKFLKGKTREDIIEEMKVYIGNLFAIDQKQKEKTSAKTEDKLVTQTPTKSVNNTTIQRPTEPKKEIQYVFPLTEQDKAKQLSDIESFLSKNKNTELFKRNVPQKKEEIVGGIKISNLKSSSSEGFYGALIDQEGKKNEIVFPAEHYENKKGNMLFATNNSNYLASNYVLIDDVLYLCISASTKPNEYGITDSYYQVWCAYSTSKEKLAKLNNEQMYKDLMLSIHSDQADDFVKGIDTWKGIIRGTMARDLEKIKRKKRELLAIQNYQGSAELGIIEKFKNSNGKTFYTSEGKPYKFRLISSSDDPDFKGVFEIAEKDQDRASKYQISLSSENLKTLTNFDFIAACTEKYYAYTYSDKNIYSSHQNIIFIEGVFIAYSYSPSYYKYYMREMFFPQKPTASRDELKDTYDPKIFEVLTSAPILKIKYDQLTKWKGGFFIPSTWTPEKIAQMEKEEYEQWEKENAQSNNNRSNTNTNSNTSSTEPKLNDSYVYVKNDTGKEVYIYHNRGATTRVLKGSTQSFSCSDNVTYAKLKAGTHTTWESSGQIISPKGANCGKIVVIK